VKKLHGKGAITHLVSQTQKKGGLPLPGKGAITHLVSQTQKKGGLPLPKISGLINFKMRR
jgi:hypothetical protein